MANEDKLAKSDASRFGKKFYKDAYNTITKLTGISPIQEGKILRDYVRKILTINIMKLNKSDLKKVNDAADAYKSRMKKFWQKYLAYCYYFGRIRALDYMPMSDENQKRHESYMKELKKL